LVGECCPGRRSRGNGLVIRFASGGRQGGDADGSHAVAVAANPRKPIGGNAPGPGRLRRQTTGAEVSDLRRQGAKDEVVPSLETIASRVNVDDFPEGRGYGSGAKPAVVRVGRQADVEHRHDLR
jgi:hypothetical protein